MFKRQALRLHRTVIAHTHDGRSFVGVLIGVYHDAYVLAHASALPDRAPIAGEVVLPASNVSWFQQDVPDEWLKPPTEE